MVTAGEIFYRFGRCLPWNVDLLQIYVGVDAHKLLGGFNGKPIIMLWGSAPDQHLVFALEDEGLIHRHQRLGILHCFGRGDGAMEQKLVAQRGVRAGSANNAVKVEIVPYAVRDEAITASRVEKDEMSRIPRLVNSDAVLGRDELVIDERSVDV